MPQASSGMYAFGDAVLFVAVLAVVALAPTGAALFSPDRFPRVALLTATVMEVAVSAYGGVVWLVPMIFLPR